MKKRVALFYMVNGHRNHGGAAYVTHLCHALRMHDLDPLIVRVSRGFKAKEKTGHAGAGHFGDGINYVNLNVEAALAFAKQYRALIAVSHFQDFIPETQALLEAGVPWVLHAQANVPEPGSELEASMKKAPIIAIRESLRVLANKLGCDARYIPHPYKRADEIKPHPQRYHASACSRIDFAKHTDVIIQANELLPDEKRVQIFGVVNRMFAFHTLDKKFPGWRENHRGPFELGGGTNIFASSEWAVDMTYWSHDRGGTQYTFFEAWDADTPLILHEKWHEPSEPTSRAAFFVEDYLHLAELLRDGTKHPELLLKVTSYASDVLGEHGAMRVGAMYKNLWSGAPRVL